MAKHAQNTKKNKTVIYILSSVLLVAIIAAVVIFITMKNKSETSAPKATEFVEHQLETFSKNDTVEIDDPELGHITIETLKGATKNTYINENFKEDENGIKKYYVNGEVASSSGVDLSEHQGEIDFEILKNAGIDYVMLRIAARGYGEKGQLFRDEMFDENYDKAKAAGLKVGAYFFSQSVTVDEAKEEAQYAIDILNGRTLEYPIAYDFETIADDDARTDDVSSKDLTDMSEAFCDAITQAGYKSMIYSNTALMYYKYDLETMRDYDFWVADYGEYPSMYYGFTMWQYTAKGRIEGIDCDLDINVNFKNY